MKKSCSCSVYALTARRPVCWFDALQPVTQIVTFYAILEIISVHILTQFLFAFIENMYFLPNNWEHCVKATCDILGYLL